MSRRPRHARSPRSSAPICFTKFNALIGSLFAIVIICGAYRDALFGGVVVANTLIGIVQEVRAKRTLDRLTVVNAPKVTPCATARSSNSAVNDLVLDDVCDLLPGQQIVADSIVLTATNLEVDESLLTGEADPIVKQPGDELLSGSFVVAGSGRGAGEQGRRRRLRGAARRGGPPLHARAQRAAGDHRSHRHPRHVRARAHRHRAVHQPAAPRDGSIRDGLVSAVGGVVAMVPEGLILLTSVAFTVGVVRLAQQAHARAGAAGDRGARPRRRDLHRQDRHDHVRRDGRGRAASCSARRRSIEPSRRRPRRARLVRPEPERDAEGAAGAVRRARPVGPTTGSVRVLVGAQVERVVVRRPRHVGVRRAGDGAAGRRVPARWPNRSSAPPTPATACLLLATSDEPLAGETLPDELAPSRSCCSRIRSAPTRPRRWRTSPSRA